MAELDDKLYELIQKHSMDGDAFVENEAFKEAYEQYWKAFDLIPEPKTDWEVSTWVLVAIGDTHFLENDFEAGLENLSNAMHCPGAIGNPFIHLRLGQCQFELGNFNQAADELTRAFALEGEEIFQDDDPKYFEFLKTKIDTQSPE